ncbi:MAG: hypothetical protein IT462_02870 [Planctomycetes bacterium]|nr:hypothetical protein [Planctomycetota bacterium]
MREESRSGWIQSEAWDKRWLIFTCLLAPVPVLIYYISKLLLARFSGMDAPMQEATAEDIVSLAVMGFAGGPHVWVTYTRTYLNKNFRSRYKLWFASSLFVLPFTAFMGMHSETSRKLLMTGFFFLASFHIVHQLSYVVRFYQDRDAAKPTLWSRAIDVGAVVFPLYPVATFRMVLGNHSTLAYQWTYSLFGEYWANTGLPFRIGRVAPLLPDFVLSDWFWIANTLAFLFFTSLWIAKCVREYRAGTLHIPKFLLITCAIAVAIFASLWPNLDSSFQGFNLWHSVQYLALTWYITQQEQKRGYTTNGFVKRISQPESGGRRYYLIALGALVTVMLLMVTIGLVISYTQNVGMFGQAGTMGQTDQPGAFLQAYYLIGFGLLLTHYFHDFWFFNTETYAEAKA